MARGPKRHMKRMATPSHWCLDKLTGVWAPKPSSGPHKSGVCMPLSVLVRNRLKYALNYKEAQTIMIQRLIKVDGKIRTDQKYPAGLMDVVSIEKTKENFRLLYDTKGRFAIHRITPEEAKYKLLRVKHVEKGAKGVTHCITHDGRTVRFPHPEVRANDTIRFDFATASSTDYVKFEHGNVCMVIGGNNVGRVGVLAHREKHPGNFEIVHLKDADGHAFATRLANVMVIGKGAKPWVSLPKAMGIKKTIIEDRKARMEKNKKN